MIELDGFVVHIVHSSLEMLLYARCGWWIYLAIKSRVSLSSSGLHLVKHAGGKHRVFKMLVRRFQLI